MAHAVERKMASVSLKENSAETNTGDEAKQRAQVLYHYNFNNYCESAQKLPIIEWEKELIQHISMEPVTVIMGATGSGKSTQVPQFVLNKAAQNLSDINIVVTQPRRLAAMTLAQRICDERKWRLGTLVGYQVGLDSNVGPDTRLTFMTTEVLVQKLIHRKDLSEYTHIIVDEVHERDCQTDFLLLLIKKLMGQGSFARVILMSATIESNKFASYFASCLKGWEFTPPVIVVAEKTLYPIEYSYLDTVLKITKRTDYQRPEFKFFDYNLLPICKTLIQSFDADCDEENSGKKGAVLVFLPGCAEIEALLDQLSEVKDAMGWEIFPLHSLLPSDQQRNVFKSVPAGKRKIIVATNIAESSITVNDCSYVIDFCLSKTLECDPETHYTRLVLDYASQANCEQRGGRTGRVGPGKVFRMVTRGTFSTFHPYTIPEMLRVPLSSVVLKAKRLDMGGPSKLLRMAMDAPDTKDIYATILILKQIGALTLKSTDKEDESGDLTYLGQVAALLPLAPQLSKLIVLGCLFGCAQDAIIIAAGLSINNLFSRPHRKELASHMNKVSMAYGSSSDCVAIINAYNLWYRKRQEVTKSRHHDPTRHWAIQNYIQPQALKEMELLIHELRRRLEMKGFKLDHKNIASEQYGNKLKMCIAAAFYPNYFSDTAVKTDSCNYYREVLDFDPFQTVRLEGLPAGNPQSYQKDLELLFGRFISDFNVFINGRQAFLMLNNRQNLQSQQTTNCHDFSGRIIKLSMALKIRLIARLQKQLNVELKPYVEKYVFTPEISIDHYMYIERSLPPGPAIKNWEIIPTCIVDASTFWAIDASSLTEQRRLDQIIRDFIPRLERVDPTDIKEGASFLVPDGDSFVRATVLTCTSMKSITVFHVDKGSQETIAAGALRYLTRHMCDTPRLAIECTLAGITLKPKQEKWSAKALLLTKSLIHLQTPTVVQIFSVTNDIVHINIDYEEKDGTTITLQKKLINEGHAMAMTEVHISRQSNLKREAFLHSTSLFLANERYRDMRQIRGQRCRISGPFSPLESSFAGNNRHGCSLHVDIDSVNNPCIDVVPDSTIPQFLVPALIHQSQGQYRGRCTTLMPRLPGLVEISSLLFCPVAHLCPHSSNEFYSCFVTGLGCGEDNEPMLPANDLVMRSSFRLENQHIEMINEIRYEMSFVLSRLKDDSNFDITKSRETLETKLNALLEMEKTMLKSDEVTCLSSLDMIWNSIDNDDLLVPTANEELEGGGVYPMIRGSSLVS